MAVRGPIYGGELVAVIQGGQRVWANRDQVKAILAAQDANPMKPVGNSWIKPTGDEFFAAIQGGERINFTAADLTAWLATTTTAFEHPHGRGRLTNVTGAELLPVTSGGVVGFLDIGDVAAVGGMIPPTPTIVPIPPGLGWTPNDFVIYDLNGASYTDFSMAAVKPVPDYIYYCSPTGSASASPASNDPATPITLRRLVTLANAHGGVIQAYLAGGQYYGNIGFDGNNITCAGLIVEPWVGQGTGRPVLIKRNTNQAIPLQPATNAWYLDQGMTYRTRHVVSGMSGVWDLLNRDAKGAPIRPPYAADLATCRATLGTCWWDGDTSTGNMYVTAFDGRSLIGDQSTMIVTTNSRAFLYNRAGNAICWMKGIDIIGGTAFQIQTAGTSGKFYAEDCGFYSGDGSSTGSDSMLGNIDCRLVQCIFGGSVEDGFNIHGNATGDVRALTDRCHGVFSGYNATGANNTSTAHENCKIIEVAPDHYGSQNRTIHHIQNAKSFMVRPKVGASKATDATSVTIAAGSAAGQTTEIWIWGNGGIENSQQGGFYAYAGSAIRYANGDFAGVTVAPGSAGTIASYIP